MKIKKLIKNTIRKRYKPVGIDCSVYNSVEKG